jgi:hypothetical protein
VAAVLAALAGACGKRGDPLPPLRTTPSRIDDLAAHRVDDRVDVSWTVPATNTDGTTPPAVTRVDLYARSTTATEPALTVEAVRLPEYLVARVIVGGAADAAAPSTAGTAPAAPAPAPGERAIFTERTDALTAPGAAVRHYLAVPVAGGGGGRPGPPSELVSVPLAAVALPAPPGDVTATYTETTLEVSWTPAGAGQSFRVLTPVAGPAAPTPVTPKPIAESRYAEPVQFGTERCFVVRTLLVRGSTTLEGPPSLPACLTAVDRFPPAAPATLQAIQEGASVALIWARVEAADLAGYVVLRGEGGGENMQPLVGAPVPGTSYRDETVKPGVAYVYAVYAQDRAMPPNVSQLSPRQTVLVQ